MSRKQVYLTGVVYENIILLMGTQVTTFKLETIHIQLQPAHVWGRL
jgi:hypothetical protein